MELDPALNNRLKRIWGVVLLVAVVCVAAVVVGGEGVERANAPWELCQAAYSKLRTASDSARLDHEVAVAPGPRGRPAHTCGELRRQRTGRRGA